MSCRILLSHPQFATEETRETFGGILGPWSFLGNDLPLSDNLEQSTNLGDYKKHVSYVWTCPRLGKIPHSQVWNIPKFTYFKYSQHAVS
jgi:hypothetical protein